MATRLRDLVDLDVAPLTAAKNRYVMRYNSTSDKFDLIPFDTALSVSAEDGDIDDSFVDQLEVEVEPREGANFRYDGGSF
jgi:hypothetical protein